MISLIRSHLFISHAPSWFALVVQFAEHCTGKERGHGLDSPLQTVVKIREVSFVKFGSVRTLTLSNLVLSCNGLLQIKITGSISFLKN